MLTPRQWFRICLAKNWVPLLTPLWPPSLFLLLDLTGCVWRIFTCHCTCGHSQLPLIRPCFSTFSQQHHPPVLGPCCLPCPMLMIGSMVFHLPHWSGSSPSGPGISLFIRYWRGVTLHCSSYSCPECHNTADPSGDHQVGCGGGEWRQDHQAQCHSRCRLYSAAQSAALAVVTNLISDSLQTSWCLSSHLELWLVSCSWCTCGLSPPTTLWEKQHPLLAVPCKLVLSASCPPTAWHAD